ncbi:3-hydroxyacyl-CoA dehydrogenase [Lutibaculum baratangense AMV1]|uniref:L-carnitine dehydrogenase n=1 Tax=Lutibaculum baratangense AMV1 TaxID=631454 RepID=V4QUP7_9HYPH|nr:3-hydroxyacyl-CoA dehydrogenase [Lutibaculum baratangense AMV1]
MIGGGVIGAGWVARYIHNGIDVAIFDPDPEAPRKVGEVVAGADRAYARLTNAPQTAKGSYRFASSVADAVKDAELITEAAPEQTALKRKIYAEIEAAAGADVPIASSTSGIKPTDLQAEMKHPGRLLVAHPFNPVYLLPLVEIVGGEKSSEAAMTRAEEIFSEIGMKPLRIRKEIDAFVADRFLEAVWREALWLVKDGVATTEEIDDAIRFGFGLRWAQMGLFETYRVAGGEAGMRHFMAQFGPTLSWPWTKLMDVPEFNNELVDLIAGQSDAQSGHRSIRELERIRDENLVAIMQALKGQNDGKGWGAGETLRQYEDRLYARAHARAAAAEHDITKPLRLHETTVSPAWTDYNGHMTEFRYLQVLGDATDALLRFVGMDEAYNASGRSFYTVETHIRHLREVRAGKPIHALTTVLMADEKKLHLFHEIRHGETDEVLATGEHLLLHVDTKEGRACPAGEEIQAKAKQIAAAHEALPRPEGAGRSVGQKK